MKRPDILTKIVNAKRDRVEKAKSTIDLGLLAEKARAARTPASQSFASAFANRERVNIIAEFKRASPSKGSFSAEGDAAKTAFIYETGGAAAVSVITEEDFFAGSSVDLISARASTSLPILRKDFIFDEFQIYESSVIGADAVLLIVAMLEDDRIRQLLELANEIHLDVLVEVHNEDEMRRAIGVGAKLIGVNNRNLYDFRVDLETSVRLSKLAPAEVVLVAESGIDSRDNIERLLDLGYSGFLIGEALMTSPDPIEKLSQLIG